MKAYLISLLFLFRIICSFGQEILPASNVYLFDYEIKENTFNINSVKLLSDFNPKGYNNQASFINDQTYLLSSNFYNNAQTDIIKLNLAKKTMQRITDTQESEYSPIYNPKLSAMSTIRVEGNGDQMLHIYKTNGFNVGYKILEETKNVGYHVWDKVNNLYLYLVEPNNGSKLVIANTQTERIIPIIENIGRCLKIGNDGELYFVHKVTDDAWYIKSYNAETRKLTTHIRALKGKEDFEMIGTKIISGSGALLYHYNIGIDTEWTKLADLSNLGVKNISRLNLRNTKLLLIDKSAK